MPKCIIENYFHTSDVAGAFFYHRITLRQRTEDTQMRRKMRICSSNENIFSKITPGELFLIVLISFTSSQVASLFKNHKPYLIFFLHKIPLVGHLPNALFLNQEEWRKYHIYRKRMQDFQQMRIKKNKTMPEVRRTFYSSSLLCVFYNRLIV